MPDLQEQLQSILGDPEAMGQIAALARALTGGQGGPAAPQGEGAPASQPAQEDGDFVPVEDAASEPVDPTQPAFPQPAQEQTAQAPDLSALMGLLGSSSGLDIDPRLIQTALRIYSEYSAQDNERAALLAALKPFLREERLEKMEKAEKAARLSRLVRTAIRLLKEGDHV